MVYFTNFCTHIIPLRRKMKKLINSTIYFIFALTLFTCLSLTFSQKQITTHASSSECNFTNLIVFVKFKNEDEFINDIYGNTSVAQLTENCYSQAEYSVKDYYKRVSNNKLNMKNVYLFNNGNSLTLSHERGYYHKADDTNSIGYDSDSYLTRMSELRQDWGQAISNALAENQIQNLTGDEIYPLSYLDRNNDGYIDNITIIYKYSSDYNITWSDCLWNYQSTSNYIEVTDNSTILTSNSYVQITANYSSVVSNTLSGIKFGHLKTMIHEMGHVFGLKDLYKTETNSPVYFMSAMAKAISPVPQYISAKEREALGWLDSNNIKTMHSAGQYTINVTTSEVANNVICYKCDLSSINKTLYLEYRKFNGSENKYDTQDKTIYDSNGNLIKGNNLKSGLVCFLVDSNTKFPNNLYSSKNNWNYEVVGGQYSTKSDSALTTGESLAITSNLTVEVLSVDNNQLTFSIQGNDINEEHVHNYTKTEFKDSTCTSFGNIEYYYCEDCKTYFSSSYSEIDYSDTIIAKKEHTPQLKKGKPATCKETGLTDGKICEICKTTLVEQQIIDKLNHTESDWIIDKPATELEDGTRHKECTICKEVLVSETIQYVPPIIPPEDTTETTTVNTDKNTTNQTQKTIIYVSIGLGISAAFIIFIFLKRK